MGAWGTHVVGLRSNSRLFLNEYAFTLPCCPESPPATMPIDGAVGTADAATVGDLCRGRGGVRQCVCVVEGAVLIAPWGGVITRLGSPISFPEPNADPQADPLDSTVAPAGKLIGMPRIVVVKLSFGYILK